MEKFKYKAKDSLGKTIEGFVEALDQKKAAKILQNKKLLVIYLFPVGKNLLTEAKATFFSRITEADKINFTRQLATMVTAGLKLTEALAILEVQATPAMAKLVAEILRGVEAGGSLSQTLEKHPDIFDPVYISLVRAGEAAGILDNVLNRLAENLEKQREFSGKVKGALIYPAIVISGMVVVAVIMMIFVVPKLTALYDEFKADLPIATKILLKVSQFTTNFWWVMVLAAVALFFIFPQMLKNPVLKKKYDSLLFRMPVIGKLRQQIMLTEFTRTLGLLVGAGVLIVDSLEIVKTSAASPVYGDAIDQAAKNVQRGFTLAVALAETQVFPPILAQMVSVGEETGKLDEVLGKVSSYFGQEAEMSVRNLTTAMEPIIMIVLGVGVGFLVIAIIMPIYNLTSQF